MAILTALDSESTQTNWAPMTAAFSTLAVVITLAATLATTIPIPKDGIIRRLS
ncbi:MAG: hypothetical protein LBJ20_07695 [Candidatus Methanoplasma sp.]|nr:hypothetical protein [Candidatus Methanoplasma sp.]